MEEFDYQDYILLYDRRRSDGVIFRRDAFTKSIGRTVPIVYGHGFDAECLGMAVIDQDAIGIFAKCKFRDDDFGQIAKHVLIETDEYTLGSPIYSVKRDGEYVTAGSIRNVYLTNKALALTYAGNEKD